MIHLSLQAQPSLPSSTPPSLSPRPTRQSTISSLRLQPPPHHLSPPFPLTCNFRISAPSRVLFAGGACTARRRRRRRRRSSLPFRDHLHPTNAQMADHSKLKIAELKDELDKRGVAYGKSDKKQTLVNLLDGAVATPTIATAGFEPALTLSSTNDEATSVPTATSNESATSDENPLTASDAFASNNSNDVPVPLIASTAAPTATEFKSNGPSDEAHSTAAAADVPASTLTATSSRSFEDRTDTIVDEVPSGIEHSADGEDEQRGGNDVLGTDEEEIKLGALSPPTSSADAAADAKMEASAPETAVAEEHKDEAASMNDADASIPVAAAPTPAPSSVPTPPPPTPTGKRSLSPAAHDPDAKIATTSEAPPAKRTKHDEPTYPEPANFVAGSHPPTKALYITGLRRPLPDAVLIDLLEGFGELDFQAGIGKGAGNPNSETEKEGWWLSPVKSHAFAAVRSLCC